MKHNLLLVLGISILCGLLAAPLSAQSVPSSINQFNIPFEFGAAGKTMPAGVYTVYSENGRIRLQSADGHQAISLTAYNDGFSPSNDEGQLSFRLYGKQYFLAKVSDGHGKFVHGVTPSRVERETVKSAEARPGQPVTLMALLVKR